VAKKEKPAPQGPPPPPFNIGDTLTTVFRPMFFDILRPMVALDIKQGNAVGGWIVTVNTTKGLRDLGATHFSKVKP